MRNPDDEAWEELTPLNGAARHGHLELVKLLVERGAEVYSNPQATYPAVIIAAWKKQQAVVDYFLTEIPDRADGTNRLGVTINLAARQGWTDLVRRHVEADPLAVHQRGWIGDSPLHWPAHNGDTDTMGLLLARGAPVNSRNTKADADFLGFTPLIMNATQRDDCAEVTELLVAAGADIDAVDAGGKTALTHARERSLERILKVLRRVGASE